MGVQWGRIVTDLAQAERAAADGFDFVQAAASLVPDLDDHGAARQKESLRESGLPLAVCGVPLPADVGVTQQGFNFYVWTEHVRRALHRMADRGCRKVAWSDGRSRLLPIEGEVAGPKEQALQFLFMLCEAADARGITVLVEPLGPQRTIFLNSMSEIGELLPRVGKDNLSSMVSLRKLDAIGLSLGQLGDYRQLIGYSGLIGLPGDADAAGLEYCRRLWKD